jgi:predicted small lipoprotein YifL
MLRVPVVLAILLTALALQACGTKGPLYLPPPGTPAQADSKQPGTR